MAEAGCLSSSLPGRAMSFAKLTLCRALVGGWMALVGWLLAGWPWHDGLGASESRPTLTAALVGGFVVGRAVGGVGAPSAPARAA